MAVEEVSELFLDHLYVAITVTMAGLFLLSRPFQKPGPNDVQITSRTWGWTFITFGLECPLTSFAALELVPVIVIYVGAVPYSIVSMMKLMFLPIYVLMILPITGLILDSWMSDWGNLERDMKISKRLLKFNDKELEKKWGTQKIPFDGAIDAFFKSKVDFVDVYEVVQRRHSLFRFVISWQHIKVFAKEILGKALGHDHSADIADVAGVYNRGNDFYNWFMGNTMLYSCAIYTDVKETLEKAQARKLQAIANMAQFKKGMKHLDLGCGWGTLLAHVGKYFETKSLGITLSAEQAKYCRSRIKAAGCEKNTEVKVINFWNLPEDEKYDRITCLEMSEHIGIRYYAKFLKAVKNRLNDDGIFYLQIAGLRRPWQYEDLVWGLFMGRYIFPGADASCPLAWVVQQCERAGFEVHRVHNTGCHYAITIKNWYDRWVKNRKIVTAKYGEWWWRMWSIFLSWSACIAFQGSSTCWMIILRKNTKNDIMSVTIPQGLEQPVLSRTAMSVGQMEVGIREAEDDPEKLRKQIWDFHGDGLGDKDMVIEAGSNLEDEVRPPSEEKINFKELILLAFTGVVLTIGVALMWMRPVPEIPWVGLNLAMTSCIVLTALRYGYAIMMRPILYPLIKASSQPNQTVQRLGNETFQFIYYTVMTLFGYMLMKNQDFFPSFLGGSGDLINTAKNFPNVPIERSVETYFMIQLGFYVHNLLILVVDSNKNDKYEMLLYRVSSLILLVAATLNRFTLIGAIILYIHDIGDIAGSAMKALLETTASTRLITANFSILLMTWTYTRIYVLPFKMLSFIATLNLPADVINPLIGPGFFTVLVVLSLHHFYWLVLFVYIGNKFIQGETIEKLVSQVPPKKLNIMECKKEA